MKKLLILSVTMITMTLLIFNLSSCKKKNSAVSPEGLIDQQNNLVLSSAEEMRAGNYKGNEGLKGAVKTIVETEASGNSTITTSKNQKDYNRAGYLTSDITYTGTDFTNKSRETTITYDNSNFITTHEFKFYSGNTVSSGNKTEYTITGGEITTFKESFWSNTRWILSSHVETTYQSKGKATKVVSYQVTDGVKTDVVETTTLYTYDKNGNPLTDITYEGVKAAAGDIINKGDELTYDDKGNWTERKEYNNFDNTLSSTTTRTITYY